jgi:hypothetical protein
MAIGLCGTEANGAVFERAHLLDGDRGSAAPENEKQHFV